MGEGLRKVTKVSHLVVPFSRCLYPYRFTTTQKRHASHQTRTSGFRSPDILRGEELLGALLSPGPRSFRSRRPPQCREAARETTEVARSWPSGGAEALFPRRLNLGAVPKLGDRTSPLSCAKLGPGGVRNVPPARRVQPGLSPHPEDPAPGPAQVHHSSRPPASPCVGD